MNMAISLHFETTRNLELSLIFYTDLSRTKRWKTRTASLGIPKYRNSRLKLLKYTAESYPMPQCSSPQCPCRESEYFLIAGGEQNGTVYDTRHIAVKGPYLFCRTYSELLINFEVELLSESSHVEPVYFIVYHRLDETEPWITMLVSTYFCFLDC